MIRCFVFFFLLLFDHFRFYSVSTCSVSFEVLKLLSLIEFYWLWTFPFFGMLKIGFLTLVEVDFDTFDVLQKLALFFLCLGSKWTAHKNYQNSSLMFVG